MHCQRNNDEILRLRESQGFNQGLQYSPARRLIVYEQPEMVRRDTIGPCRNRKCQRDGEDQRRPRERATRQSAHPSGTLEDPVEEPLRTGVGAVDEDLQGPLAHLAVGVRAG